MDILPLPKDLDSLIDDQNLRKKWDKVKKLFKDNISPPSLNTELLEPKWRGIYSFRIDKIYRALFFFTKENAVEVFAITKHYKK